MIAAAAAGMRVGAAINADLVEEETSPSRCRRRTTARRVPSGASGSPVQRIG